MLQFSERFAVFKTKYFLFGFMIRFILLFVIGGEILEKYFVPFLDHFAQYPATNTWASFAPEFFPYGLFPLLAFGLPKLIAFKLFGGITLGNSIFNFALIKGILLCFEIVLFWVLTRLTTYNIHRLTWFYWLNPISIYVTYVLGHFDIISMSLITVSLFLLGKNLFRISGILAGLALASKFQVAIILPFIAAFIWNNNYLKVATRRLIDFGLPLVLVSLVGFIPLLEANHFSYSTFSSPEAMRLLAAKISLGSGNDFVIGIGLVILVLGRLVFATRITFQGLLYGSGLLLGTLVLTTNAQPGWYLWYLPTMALFFANYITAPTLIFVLFSIVYLLHFFVAEVLMPPFKTVSFTVLQLGVLVQLLLLYWIAIKQEALLRNRLRPVMLGLSGDSGAGKNHLCATIQALMDPNNCIVIEGDNYHKWERGDKNWEVLTHLNPSANNLIKMQEHAKQISMGQPILHHHYDHGTGKFVLQPPTNPTKTIVFQGLHSLYLKSLREILDLRIFLDPDEKVRTFWKIQRDVFERGHTLQKVLDSLAKRKIDSLKHILPQKDKSDWVVEICTDADFDPISLTRNSSIPLYVRYILYNDEPIADLMDQLQEFGIQAQLEFLESDLDRVRVSIRGSISPAKTEEIAKRLFPQMRHLTRSSIEPKFLGDIEGIHQLFMLALLSKRLEALT